MNEKDLTLEIAGLLEASLESAGIAAVLTRAGDEYLTNTQRAELCNAAGADTVLSIHLNASTDPRIDYFRAFYGKRNKDSAFTQVIWDNYLLTNTGGTGTIDKTAPTQFASGVLLKTNAPATLAETVFLSNPEEQALLNDGTGQRQQDIAEQLFNGLLDWYGL